MIPALLNTTILVVDDDADTGQLLRSVFEQAGASVATVSSVDSALETFRHCPPHAVVIDIRLGASDGYALIHAIRELNRAYKGFTPAIAMTGYAAPEEKERALAEGFNAFFAKPFDPFEVVEAMTRALSGPLDEAA
jgi:CheY-like chemotaxis protein